jgi:hypothetical protein
MTEQEYWEALDIKCLYCHDWGCGHCNDNNEGGNA